jgi:serine/threonine protein kinase
MKTSRVIPPAESIHILRSITTGLQYIHGMGYAHRDLKPDNLIRCGPLWKILDFGFVDESNVAHRQACCTPLYMSPEILTIFLNEAKQNGIYYGIPSDIWALGIILNQMLSGKEPYIGIRSLKDLYTAVVVDPIQLADVDKPILNLLGRLLDPNPKTRITTSGILEHPVLNEYRSYYAKFKIIENDIELEDLQYGEFDKNSYLNVRVLGPPAERIFICALLEENNVSYGQAFLSRSDARSCIMDMNKNKLRNQYIFGDYVSLPLE